MTGVANRPPVIFATVGNANQAFNRLIETIDELAATGAVDGVASFIQTGRTSYMPRCCAWSTVLPPDEFLRRLRAADVVVCHGGAGTLIQVLGRERVPVVMPRRAKYGEHVDDHQVELASALAMSGRIVVAWEPADMLCAIRDAMVHPPMPTNGATRLVSHIGATLRGYLGGGSVSQPSAPLDAS